MPYLIICFWQGTQRPPSCLSAFLKSSSAELHGTGHMACGPVGCDENGKATQTALAVLVRGMGKVEYTRAWETSAVLATAGTRDSLRQFCNSGWTGESFDLDISIGDANAATREAVTTAEFLCTDLDGSLLLVDSFWESLLALVGKHFWYVFLIPFWSLRGKAALKHEIAKRSGLNAAHLPYRAELVEFLRREKS